MGENIVLSEFCLRAKGEYILKRVRSSSKKRIWAALKRKVTVGVRECKACQRYSEKKERRPVAMVMPKSIDSSSVLALCCCYKALSLVCTARLWYGGAAGAASVRSCWKLSPRPIEPLPAGSRVGVLLAQAEPLTVAVPLG